MATDTENPVETGNGKPGSGVRLVPKAGKPAQEGPQGVADGDGGPGEAVEGYLPDPGPHIAAKAAFPPTVREPTPARRRVGRPSNPDKAPPADPLKIPQVYVPPPKAKNFSSDALNPDQRTPALWKWWGGLTPAQAATITVYVYRDWPVLKVLEGTPEKAGSNPNIDKISGGEPIQNDIEFLHRYGCGNYRIRVNVGDKGTITTGIIKGLSGDMKSYPPSDSRISDINQVDLIHPENGSYVAFLRMRGQLPDQTKENENEMAQGQAFTDMVGLVAKQMDQSNKRAAEPVGLTPEALKESLSLMREGSKEAMDTVRAATIAADETKRKAEEEARQIREDARKANEFRNVQTDPFDQALKLMSLLKESRGNDDVLSKFMEVINKNNEATQAMLKDFIAASQKANSPTGSMADSMSSLKQMREIVKEFEGGGEKDVVEEAVEDALPKWARPLIPFLPSLAAGLATFFATPRPQPVMAYPSPYPPQPYSPNPAPAMPFPPPPVIYPAGFPVQAMPNAGPMPTAPAPSGPLPVTTAPMGHVPPGPVPVPSPGNIGGVGGMELPPEVIATLEMLRVPFLKRILSDDPDDNTGTELAGWIQDGYPDELYKQITSTGPEILIQVIQAYPPIMNVLTHERVSTSRLTTFIKDFCDPQWEPETPEDKGNGGSGTVEVIPPVTQG